ncbi:DNA repair and recombination protein RAD54-like protein [Auxenochlorella protothecoides]|uniref:DNA repair and recombination protein RAD54-like protein n=1 Tax=Auxenochlorella protothecoides TaxID=3075 RepID=A0A087SNW8_AUXPR|nr:DNA repair and recombination protein RAD54-like protein [Auxenochlorella protothecoides]KFM27422.1 DNA repair and recombination protein RAD54-like protein [Auxenochlorella protothecoides]
MPHAAHDGLSFVPGSPLEVARGALLPKILIVAQGEAVLKKPFKSPHPGAPAKSNIELPPGIEPLILWTPAEGQEGTPVEVDPMLTRWLRPHQREGVAFMFECVTGLRPFDGQGCILADDMGLGKTLQGIGLLWTLLHARAPALGGTPVAKRAIICCPTSLVANWDSECSKWLDGRVRTLPLAESSREDVIAGVNSFLHPNHIHQVMIVSYETFRLHAERFREAGTCDLLICDEAHRLKNDATLTNRALGAMACRRRVLLSGTPLQNKLDEFYAMVDFCNPGVLGGAGAFRRYFEGPILAGREPDASDAEVEAGASRTAELSSIVNHFILRRTNTLLSAHLPPKVVEVVCCSMTPLQASLYTHFLDSKAAAALFTSQRAARVLSAITSLKKLLSHPKLIYDTLHAPGAKGGEADGFAGAGAFFPPGLFDDGRPGRGSMPLGWEHLSGKFSVLAKLLDVLRRLTTDRIVVVSNYTQTLDLVGQLCRERGYPFLRLDGSTTINKRQKLVKAFCDPTEDHFVFLLSSKAGGCGLNLIGGNRLVYVYRFLTTGTIEEKVYQRQLSKEGLQQELRDLFTHDAATLSSTYDAVCAKKKAGTGGGGARLAVGGAAQAPQRAGAGPVGHPPEEDLGSWAHHRSVHSVPDPALREAGGEHVSFVFALDVAGRDIGPEAPLAPVARRPGSGAAPWGGRAGPGRSAAPRPALDGDKENLGVPGKVAAAGSTALDARGLKPTMPRPMIGRPSGQTFSLPKRIRAGPPDLKPGGEPQARPPVPSLADMDDDDAFL